MSAFGRILGFGLLCAGAAMLLMFSLMTPLLLRQQVAEDRVHLAEFERAAAYAEAYRQQHRQLPDDLTLRRWAESQRPGGFASSLSIAATGCTEEGFAVDKRDSFVLSAWRGEWSECYAAPSGRTTMPLSVAGYLRTWLGAQLLVSLLLGLCLAYGAWRILRGGRPTRPI